MNNLSAYLTFITTPALGRLNFHSCLAWECSEIRWRRKKRRAEGKENETLCLLLCRGINYTSSSREAVFNFFLSSFQSSVQCPLRFPNESPQHQAGNEPLYSFFSLSISVILLCFDPPTPRPFVILGGSLNFSRESV